VPSEFALAATQGKGWELETRERMQSPNGGSPVGALLQALLQEREKEIQRLVAGNEALAARLAHCALEARQREGYILELEGRLQQQRGTEQALLRELASASESRDKLQSLLDSAAAELGALRQAIRHDDISRETNSAVTTASGCRAPTPPSDERPTPHEWLVPSDLPAPSPSRVATDERHQRAPPGRADAGGAASEPRSAPRQPRDIAVFEGAGSPTAFRGGIPLTSRTNGSHTPSRPSPLAAAAELDTRRLTALPPSRLLTGHADVVVATISSARHAGSVATGLYASYSPAPLRAAAPASATEPAGPDSSQHRSTGASIPSTDGIDTRSVPALQGTLRARVAEWEAQHTLQPSLHSS
jgi:hypothetical protein